MNKKPKMSKTVKAMTDILPSVFAMGIMRSIEHDNHIKSMARLSKSEQGRLRLISEAYEKGKKDQAIEDAKSGMEKLRDRLKELSES